MDFNELAPEQQAKADACETSEDMLALAREEGYELSDEELEAVGGGWGSSGGGNVEDGEDDVIEALDPDRKLVIG